MIGKVIVGKSFRGCIAYCLEDKKLSTDKALTTHRAEVISYNLCFGNKRELTEQFGEVRNLNQRLSKPVLHITLSLAKEERVGTSVLQQIVEDCAKHMGFEKNQYLAIEHRDTAHQHLHIVANRIGFDGKTINDSNSYKRMAEFCRQTELKYGLKSVLSPRRFLSEELRNLPRNDSRKQALKSVIVDALWSAKSYEHFERVMKEKGYKIEKGRGIAFIDKKGVRTKGSEVGYPLSKIERILGYAIRIHGKELNHQTNQHPGSEKSSITTEGKEQQKALSETLQNVLHPEDKTIPISSDLLPKKKKKKRRSIHL